MKMKNYIPFLPVLFLLLGFSCNNPKKSVNQKEEPSGGSCSYNTQIIPAEVINVYPNPNDTSVYEAWFVIKKPENLSIQAEDTFIYSIHGNRGYIPHADIIKYDIKPGALVQFKIMHIIEGSCTDYIEDLSLEKYVQK